MTTRIRRSGLLMVVGVASLCSGIDAAEPIGMAVGGRAVVSGVRFACGEWSIKSRQTCPAAARGREPKFAIYAMTLNENVMNLAVAIDKRIAEDESLKWSFVEILDEKGARSSEADEMEERLKEVRELAAQHGVQRLTLGISASPASTERPRIRIPKDTDTLVVFLNGDARRSRMVRFAERVDSSTLDEKKIEKLLAKIAKIHKR